MTRRKIRQCNICGKEIGNKFGRWKYCFEHRSSLHQRKFYLGLQVEIGWVAHTELTYNIITGHMTFTNRIMVRKGSSYRNISLKDRTVYNSLDHNSIVNRELSLYMYMKTYKN